VSTSQSMTATASAILAPNMKKYANYVVLPALRRRYIRPDDGWLLDECLVDHVQSCGCRTEERPAESIIYLERDNFPSAARTGQLACPSIMLTIVDACGTTIRSHVLYRMATWLAVCLRMRMHAVGIRIYATMRHTKAIWPASSTLTRIYVCGIA
jgi:hypothetical protein